MRLEFYYQQIDYWCHLPYSQAIDLSINNYILLWCHSSFKLEIFHNYCHPSGRLLNFFGCKLNSICYYYSMYFGDYSIIAKRNSSLLNMENPWYYCLFVKIFFWGYQTNYWLYFVIFWLWNLWNLFDFMRYY